ncbi:hypothetical protein Ntsu_52200 [Nocardia sp. IFM 10818]
MDIADALALIGEEQPAGWVQYHDGSWAPVWRNGQLGPSFTISELTQLPTNSAFAAFPDECDAVTFEIVHGDAAADHGEG